MPESIRFPAKPALHRIGQPFMEFLPVNPPSNLRYLHQMTLKWDLWVFRYGAEGQLPPNSYGVHAEPIASILREYGVSATARKGMTYYEIKQQIASGNPVIAWVIGNVWNGSPVSYTSESGNTTTVARYEHTVIVIGYDEYGVTVVDGSMVYWRSKASFLNSFSVLGNMAIYHP